MVNKLFIGRGIATTIKNICQACTLCAYNNPGQKPSLPPLIEPIQRRGTYPGEDWQIDFTKMPPCKGYKYLLVLVDTFTGRIEAFPTRTEKATEVVKALLKEIIPRFGLPRSLQSDNGPSFTSKITQAVSEALGIKYYLHSAWRPQSSGKVERANQTLKRTLAKLCQETSENWTKLLPIALMRLGAPLRPILNSVHLKCCMPGPS